MVDIALASFGKKLEKGVFPNEKSKGIFSMKSKNLCKKNHGVFFNVTQPTRVKNEKFIFSKLYLIKKLKVQVQMT